MLIKHLPDGLSIYSPMRAVLLFERDTSPERVILYAMTEDRKWAYIPSAGGFIKVETSFDIEPWLPVYLYSGWAQSKIDRDRKYKWHHATMSLHSVVPEYIWSKR